MAKIWDLGRVVPRSAAFRTLVLDALAIEQGQRVLDIGCGAGSDLALLREAVGPAGHVLGYDLSAKSVARARKLVDEHGWDNVELRVADATTVQVRGFDAALASFSLSATDDVPAALEHARAALRPGGRLFVIDMDLSSRTALNRVFGVLYRRLAGWTGVDVLEVAEEMFSAVRAPKRSSWPPVQLFTALR